MKKLLTRLALLMILCAALALPVFADAVTDSISVCIGYFGWSEDEYVEKTKFSWQELDDWYGGALDTHEEYYSYCNGSGRTYLAFARGFYIRDLLDYAGVDVNSISDTVLDMPLQNNLSYFVKCRFRCIYLCKDVFARNIFINHTVNRLYLSDDFF